MPPAAVPSRAMTFEPVVAVDPAIRRPTYAEIDLHQLTANYRAIDAATGDSKMLPILKANAYGHGLVAVAKHLEELSPAGFGVAFLEEGILLRESGVSSPILVMGGLNNAQIPHFLDNDLTITASSVYKLAEIERVAANSRKTARVHLKIDTGMGRIGMRPESAPELFSVGLRSPNIDVKAVYSHFATADEADPAGTDDQLERFLETVSYYEAHGEERPELHIANSGGILQHPRSHLDLVRAGILLFGVYPSEEVSRSIDVSPALTWKSQVAYFKVQHGADPVSYGSTWAPESDTRLITIPAGYGDGYFRALSNGGQVIVDGRLCPIAGRICMDQFMVDIGPDGTAYNGDEVILMGSRDGLSVTADDIARWAGTIPHEVLTSINARVPRRYVGGTAT